MKSLAPLAILLLTLSPVLADPGAVANGWRGNGTGRYPDARPPLTWGRTPKGVATDLRTRADRPDANVTDGVPLAKGIVPHWLAIGPFPVGDTIKDFAKASPIDESVQPTTGDKIGELEWKPFDAGVDDRFKFGPATAPVADLGAALGYKPNHVSYAHAYLFSPKGGPVRAVVDHMFGMKAWLNGKTVYQSADRKVSLGSYYPLSRVEIDGWALDPSPTFEMNLKPGWNRLLVMISAFNREDASWRQQNFHIRIADMPGIAYDNTNILWMTELSQRSNATPIVVGDRVFVMAEPDELVCLDKNTGKILWTAANNYYEAVPADERAALPALAEKVSPLLASIKAEPDFAKRLQLRTKLQNTLVGIDKDRFAWKADGHFSAHFGIVGFTTPSPVSDGKNVWVWCGNGVAACYDLDGKRRWITRASNDALTYSSSPALADGVFGVYLNKLIGIDAETGKIRWEQKKIDINYGSILAGRIANTPVFVTSLGHVVRASDGKLLYKERDRNGGAATWTAPVILGDKVYCSRYGATQLLILDFAGATGDEWEAKRQHIQSPDGINKHSTGRSLERSTAGSPLVVGDLVYSVDIYSTLYCFDVKANKLLYSHETDLAGLFHYNAVPIAASATLVGDKMIIQDNQGLALVLEPGRQFKQVGRNHIGTQIDRFWPLPPQETLGYAPPVPDGDRMYLRGERYLYCIGAK